MSFTINNAEQRSPEWFKARLGRATGSRASDILATIKSGEAAARRDYRMQLAVERLTGNVQEDGYVSKEMQWGIDCEPAAFAAYEAMTGDILTRTGFLVHGESMSGCSLDASVNNFSGIVEMKCPKSTTHYGYLKANVVPSTYLPQVRHNLFVTGAEWADFVSFDPRMPEGLQFFCKRLKASEANLNEYEDQLHRFLAEVAIEVSDIQNMRGAA